MDANTGLAILGAAIGSKEIVVKVLGPTADYLGAGLKDWTEIRLTNVARIFENAHGKLGDREEVEGGVHPKVLKEILDDGSFAEDQLAAEYFGGVLASSRTGISRDDRGAGFARLVAQLTTYQLRSHYFFYQLFKLVHDGSGLSVMNTTARRSMRMFIPGSSYAAAMELSPDEVVDWILPHVMFGLRKQGLIDDEFAFGPPESLTQFFPEVVSDGLVVGPSALGVELFHWAHGLGNVPIPEFLLPDTKLSSGVSIATLPGFRAIRTNEGEKATAG